MAEIRRHPSIRRDLKTLSKYRTATESIEAFERLLSSTFVPPRDHYPNLKCKSRQAPPDVFKSRVALIGYGGKSSGLRYIYEEFSCDGTLIRVGILICGHQGQMGEAQIKAEILSRLRDYDTTSFDHLELGAHVSPEIEL